MTARPEVVEVLASLSPAASDLSRRPWRLVHQDGRPFTSREAELFGDASSEELQAARSSLETRRKHAESNVEDLTRLARLARPYMTGKATIRDALPLMPAAEQAEVVAIIERITPDELLP